MGVRELTVQRLVSRALTEMTRTHGKCCLFHNYGDKFRLSSKFVYNLAIPI